ncbi:ABC transporter ATP-binding protein [Paenibacillus senegalensis]|uniref:ABC transporter ATP-binding protein n=1 Tax=Paenibacillus senegalensis TaxID=1465766 RepID=UPI000288DFDB|nr:ABC transporter ATP-binding protein [Paenibacillus senegalensis]
MLETVDLTKQFKKHLAVDRVSIHLLEGESVGLLGPNGAGKSTLISLISSLTKPTSGTVRLFGKSIQDNLSELRKVLGVVPQDIALYEELSAYENLQFFGRIYKLKGRELEERIAHNLGIMGLDDRKNDLISTYSGGMKRRINIAAALLHNPKILIMDEPTVGIDPQSRNHILESVRMLNREKGISVLYTSHYMEEVEQLCDRLYIMDHGKIVASGTKEELKAILSGDDTLILEMDRPNSAFAAELREMTNVRQVVETEKGLKLIVPKQSRLLHDILHTAESHQVDVVHFHVQNPTLEDVFLHLTGRKLRD